MTAGHCGYSRSSTSDLSVFLVKAPTFRQIWIIISYENNAVAPNTTFQQSWNFVRPVLAWCDGFIPAFMNGERDLLRLCGEDGGRRPLLELTGRRAARRCVAVYARRSQLHRAAPRRRRTLRNPPRERTYAYTRISATVGRACEWLRKKVPRWPWPSRGNILLLL